MSDQLSNPETEKQEIVEQNQAERTHESRLYVPRVDIYETDDAIHLIADIPGADENSIDITLEKNVLTIDAEVQAERPEDYSLMYAEYGIGSFRRKFNLSNEIDQEKIIAEVKDGVLKLILPKSEKISQKIKVKATK
ncbi:MAG TPA: Hsp20/alpha crystallin family protein [Anaerolineaceae bacterium]|nr:Hsp20/alpha crystallin family protein [Anaerolineaceae bacterium]